MFRTSAIVLGGGLPAKMDYHIKDQYLQNMEGWRVLDNVKMTKLEAIKDASGCGRWLDPIIDDPRLSHKQRVQRLYRWALKEFGTAFATRDTEGYHLNIGHRVIRNRFEKYRYVTDPAMCDMMVRETQKYLRETCAPEYSTYDTHYRWTEQFHREPTIFPGEAGALDCWQDATLYEIDVLKIHRMYRGVGGEGTGMNMKDKGDRYGHIKGYEVGRRQYVPIMNFLLYILPGLLLCKTVLGGLFYDWSSPTNPQWSSTQASYTDMCDRGAWEKSQRFADTKEAKSWIAADFDFLTTRRINQDPGFRTGHQSGAFY